MANKVNPKAVVGRTKAQVHDIPLRTLGPIGGVMALGAKKYGHFNWRDIPIVDDDYIDAIVRHLTDYQNGEKQDVESGESHFAHIAACCIVVLDAEMEGTLNKEKQHG